MSFCMLASQKQQLASSLYNYNNYQFIIQRSNFDGMLQNQCALRVIQTYTLNKIVIKIGNSMFHIVKWDFTVKFLLKQNKKKCETC